MRNPGNVAEFAGTMDSTAVAKQQNQSLLPETDWPGMKGILHYKTHSQLHNMAVYKKQYRYSNGIIVIVGYHV